MRPELTTFACGEVTPASLAESRLDLTLRQGGKTTPVMTLSQLGRRAMANQSTRMADLLEIAGYVYLADQAVGRGGNSLYQMASAWRRRIHLRIAVRDIDFWSARHVRELLHECIGYLSGDTVTFAFEEKNYHPALDAFLGLEGEETGLGFAPERVLLFSGGLDSLAGAVEVVCPLKSGPP